MPRVRKGAARTRARNRLHKQAKGYVGGRGRLVRAASETIKRAQAYAYRDRRQHRRLLRRLWIIRINAAARARGMKYGEFINALSRAGVTINRKMLADMAVSNPQAFDVLVEKAKAAPPKAAPAEADA